MITRRELFKTLFGAAVAPTLIKLLPESTPELVNSYIPLTINQQWGTDFEFAESELLLFQKTYLDPIAESIANHIDMNLAQYWTIPSKLQTRFDPARLPD